mmetsp:Transcript_20642/g.35324  ORF Transcript_20642/g.35324 Transcript_20642/m.35324 type:complete len:201 (+) Transcript_20642:378-980(+)
MDTRSLDVDGKETCSWSMEACKVVATWERLKRWQFCDPRSWLGSPRLQHTCLSWTHTPPPPFWACQAARTATPAWRVQITSKSNTSGLSPLSEARTLNHEDTMLPVPAQTGQRCTCLEGLQTTTAATSLRLWMWRLGWWRCLSLRASRHLPGLAAVWQSMMEGCGLWAVATVRTWLVLGTTCGTCTGWTWPPVPGHSPHC